MYFGSQLLFPKSQIITYIVSLEYIGMIDFIDLSLNNKIKTLYKNGDFIMSIRYYRYKINLYRLGDSFFEVFINHKLSIVEKIQPLDWSHSRIKFYTDQIDLPQS